MIGFLCGFKHSGWRSGQFIKSNFGGDPLQQNYVSPNLVDPSREVDDIQVFLHNIKKI